MMYREDLDTIKGFSIIAVVLFHIGLLKSGYLGVDTFFVINGFLLVPSVVRAVLANQFSFLSFLEKRLLRLSPMIIIASVLSLVLGFFLMLPDSYENLAQAVIASNLFSENILSAITTRNYWDISNDYKPLMHLWYVGILMEYYVVLPIIVASLNKFAKLIDKEQEKIILGGLCVLTILSLLAYMLPFDSHSNKFYYLPYRFFELTIGGLIALYVQNNRIGGGGKKWLFDIGFLALSLIICSSLIYFDINNIDNHFAPIGAKAIEKTEMPLSNQASLIITVLVSSLLVYTNGADAKLVKSKVLSYLGKRSYSIFIWHQVLLAFYRNSITSHVSFSFVVLFLMLVLLLSECSYRFVEKLIKINRKNLLICLVSVFIAIVPSGYLYLHAGVVRDIPELDVYKGKEFRGMFAEYCDRVYEYDRGFPENNGKINVLVIGVSFGRDFANVLLESKYKDQINLSYGFKWDSKDYNDIVTKADYIFSFSFKEDVPEYVWKKTKNVNNVYGIGTKNFGDDNGVVYFNRQSADYFRRTVPLNNDYNKLNNEMKASWGEDHYIDFMKDAIVDKDRVRVFTPGNKFISQDCHHLTPAGARWYASILNLDKIFESK